VFIYLITNSVTGKHYVGKWQGHVLAPRLRIHFNDARLGSKTYLHRSMRKHGFEKFTIHPLCSTIITKEELKHWERVFISMFKTTDRKIGYNLTPGGDGHGAKHSAETRRKIGAAQLGKKMSPEAKQRMSEAAQKRTGDKNSFFGKTRSPEARKRSGEPFLSELFDVAGNID
jgi:group I intron endonuclease